ncbi:MAG: efflux RND transporter periplasmic adaptor subunit [Candidatus Peribacteraceae bacterium]|nr:efflux RND transporter periplasmic adaptor subunit [Candidatus Peribacteraceae bacterium]
MKKFFSALWHRKWLILAGVVVALIILGVYSLSQPKPPEYVTALSTRGDLRQTVEAVGTVISDRDLALQFPTTDIVAKVFVKEGAKVKAGQQLASLRSGSLGAGVASASANVQSAVAQLRALQEGSRPEDIAITQAQVDNKKAALEAAKSSLTTAETNLVSEKQKLEKIKTQAIVGLSGQVATTNSTISQQLSSAKTALRAVEGVFSENDVNDVMTKNPSSEFDQIKFARNQTESAIGLLQTSGFNTTDYKTAITSMENARMSVSAAASIVNRAYDLIASTPNNGYFTPDRRETHKSTLAAQKTVVQSALATLDAAIKSLRDSAASYDTQITTEEGVISTLQGAKDRAKADISTYETSLRIDEAQLNLKKAPARQTDIDAAVARVRQAQADLARASSQYRDTILTAPVDGIITKVNAKAGEIRPLSDPSITMLGSSPYRVEMFISDIDVPKVILSHSGSIKLDAFPKTPFKLMVSEIDSAPTEVDGVDKYRIRLDFVYPHSELKIGMSGDTTIITGERKNVIKVPARAIIQADDGKKTVRVLDSKNQVTEKTVVDGMEGEGGDTEIISGIEEGEKVITLTKK